MAKKNDASYIWANIDRSGEHWLWKGKPDKQGRGIANWKGERNIQVARIVWELTRGPVPEGHKVAHSCDEGMCVRHTYVVTSARRGKLYEVGPCKVCLKPMLSNRALNAQLPEGYAKHKSRQLCTMCYGEHKDEHKPKKLSRDDILEEYAHLASFGLVREVIAERLGMTLGALDQAIIRGRRDGDENAAARAGRYVA